MQFLYTDESNLNPSNGFFVYAGLRITCDGAVALHTSLERLRQEYSLPSLEILKFNPCPQCLDRPRFNELKQHVLTSAAEAGCQLLVYMIHHAVIAEGDVDQSRRFGINTLLYHFDCKLRLADEYGLAMVDRFSDPDIDSHMREKFAIGVRGLPSQAERRLSRMLGCHYSAIGQSHFPSVLDIAVGSLRFAVNAHTANDDGRLPTARTLLRLLRPLLADAHGIAHDVDVALRPMEVRAPQLLRQYQRLRTFFGECGISLQ